MGTIKLVWRYESTWEMCDATQILYIILGFFLSATNMSLSTPHSERKLSIELPFSLVEGLVSLLKTTVAILPCTIAI